MLGQFIKRYFKEGSIRFLTPGGRAIDVGSDAEPAIIVRIHDAQTAFDILRNPALAVGEAYMDARLTFDRGDIFQFLDLVGRNWAHRKHRRAGRLAMLERRILQSNGRRAARLHAHHHYDLSLDLYRRFLDDDLQYSCAYFEHPEMSLEDAQAAKKRHIIAKLAVEKDQRVLDIGCGWGGLGLSLAEAGAKVTGVTLSDEQFALANRRARARGLAERAEFRLEDYRDVQGSFDRIVSVGMFEHVGVPNYQAYFDTVARLLDEDGVALIHSIGRSDGPGISQPWIDKYIFPGGYIPALSEVLPAVERAGLWVTDIEILRLHYAETLKAWRGRFLDRRREILALYDERFCRMWEFYLASSEVAFRHGSCMVFQLQLAKRRDAVPLTRDYIAEREHRAAQSRAA